jgi:hypothetical protein
MLLSAGAPSHRHLPSNTSNTLQSQDNTTSMSQAVQDTTPQTFTCFPKLPLELQREVWKYAIPKLQAIKIRVHNDNIDGNTTLPLRFSTDTHPSGLLSACKISREEILRVYKICIETKGHARKIRFDGEMVTVILHDYPEDFRNSLCRNPGDKLHSGFHSSYSCFHGVRAMAFVWYRWYRSQVGPDSRPSTLVPIFPTLKTFVQLSYNDIKAVKLCLMSSEPFLLQTPEEFMGPQLKALEHLNSATPGPLNRFSYGRTLRVYSKSEQGLKKMYHYDDRDTESDAPEFKYRFIVPADESIKDDVYRALQRRKGDTDNWPLTANLWFKAVLRISLAEVETKCDFDLFGGNDNENLRLAWEPLWHRYLEDVGKVEEAKKYGLYYRWMTRVATAEWEHSWSTTN